MKHIFKYYLTWQIAIILLTALLGPLLPLRTDYLGGATQAYLSKPLLYSRANFDGNHYLGIAAKGYGYAQQAFFPFYPNLIRFLSQITKSGIWSGILISNISIIFGLYIFYRLLILDYNPTVVHFTILALLLFPASFFFGFVYTEGLFFLLVVTSFYLSRLHKWWLACLCAALAAYTRLPGIILLPALAMELLHQQPLHHTPIKKLIKLSLPLAIIPMGTLIYMLYLHRTTGDPFAFFTVQKLFNQGRSDKIILIYQVFWRYIKMILTVNRHDPLYLTILLEFATGIIFLITSIYSFIHHRTSYAVFGFLNYLLPTLTGSFTSLARYVLISFSSFIVLGELLARLSPIKRNLLIGFSSLLFLFYLIMFVRGYWVS